MFPLKRAISLVPHGPTVLTSEHTQMLCDEQLENSTGTNTAGRRSHCEDNDGSRSSVQITVTSDIASLESEWRRLERDGDCTPFQTFDWLSTWQACVGRRMRVKPTIVVGRWREGNVAFILPLAIERTSFLRRLVFLGRDLCDYNAPILASEFSLTTTPQIWWQTISAAVRRAPEYKHDVVFLDKMPQLVGSRPNPLFLLNTNPNASNAYAMSLSTDWDTLYVAKRSAHARRSDRRKRRILESNGDLCFVTPKNWEDVAKTLDTLFVQKGRWFARVGIPNLFSKTGYTDFFLSVAAKAPNMVHVSQVNVGSNCVAANLGLLFNRSYYSVLLSHDDDKFYQCSPGTLHHHEIMRYAIAHGCTRFDFTIGDEPFKRDWADSVYVLHDYLAATNPLGYVNASLTSTQLKMKRAIKQSPSLWALATRARLAISTLRHGEWRALF